MATADSSASRRRSARRQLLWAALALLLPGAGLAARARETEIRDPVVAGWIHASDSLENAKKESTIFFPNAI